MFLYWAAEGGQLASEGDDVPEGTIGMGWTPGRHGGELDAMLDHPELFGAIERIAPGEFRHVGIEPLGDFGLFHARSEVALAAHFGIFGGIARNIVAAAKHDNDIDQHRRYCSNR